MILHTRYRGDSAIVNAGDRASVCFATNTLREPTFFRGMLARPLVFREGLAALYQVVVSDYKYRPRDRLAFRAWLEEQDRKFLDSLALKNERAKARREELETRLAELNSARHERLKPFYAARREFFDYVYESQYELSYLLDPVITVHPDEISYEAFSRDESAYARLAVGFDLFEPIEVFECGTTNIDFSAKLHGELERMRTYRRTHFAIDPTGFAVETEGDDEHKEKKIDLPESWVQGFLQVHSTMALGLTQVNLAVVDLFNICRFLRRHKRSGSPRSLRYELTPGQKARAVLEPWNHVIELTGSAVYEGPKPLSFRTWGRQRLQVLARLIPLARRITVYLAGYGLPSIYVLDLGELTFTLALSGWTDNDWTGGAAKFDLLARRLSVTPDQLIQTYHALREVKHATDSELAARTGFGTEKTRSAAAHLCQVGRAMFDLAGGCYRHRDLFGDPFTYEEASKAVAPPADDQTPQERAARQIFQRGDARVIARRPVPDGFKLSGSVRGDDGPRVRPLLHVDADGRIIDASCTCAFYAKSKLTKGPCEHILALRLAHMSRLEEEDQ